MLEQLITLLDVPDITALNDSTLVTVLLILFVVCGIIGIIKVPLIGLVSGFVLILISAWLGYNPTLIVDRYYNGSAWITATTNMPFYPYASIALFMLGATFIIFGYLDMGGSQWA